MLLLFSLHVVHNELRWAQKKEKERDDDDGDDDDDVADAEEEVPHKQSYNKMLSLRGGEKNVRRIIIFGYILIVSSHFLCVDSDVYCLKKMCCTERLNTFFAELRFP